MQKAVTAWPKAYLEPRKMQKAVIAWSNAYPEPRTMQKAVIAWPKAYPDLGRCRRQSLPDLRPI
jgi:hypothetical protein